MTKKTFRSIFIICLIWMLAVIGSTCTYAESTAYWTEIPRIDSSTARIPITNAIYALLSEKYHLPGPEPICSKTHGAWLNLADGSVDILFTVAPTAEEFQYFLDNDEQIEIKVFGYDGLVFIGNDENHVQSLTSDHVRSIYAGEITNWSEIQSGEDAPIDVYIRNAESGSQRLFEQLVWTDYDMPDFSKLGFHVGDIESVASEYKITLYDGMEGIVEGVSTNKYSIGFNIMSYVDEKFLNPSDEDHDGVWQIRATGEVNLRSGPGLSYKILGTVQENMTFLYLEEEVEDERGVMWYKVSHETLGEVWISSRYSAWEPLVRSKIKLFSIDGFAPKTENFASGDYPFVTTSIVAIRKSELENSPARRLFDWIGTEESRELIQENSTLAVSFSESFVYEGSVVRK